MKKRWQSKGKRTTPIDDEEAFLTACRRDSLRAAWSKVWRNGGAAGGDRMTVHDFANRAEMRIGVLANDLREGKYEPAPLRITAIPKRSGGVRQLKIPSVVDRIAQTAVVNVLTPFLEEEFEEASFGYRPGRSIHQAVARIQTLQREGLTHVVDADIDNYFDSVPHDLLLARLAESMTGGPLSELIALWLAHSAPHGRGLAQGSPLSPLLANLFLDRLDEAFDRHGARIVRFADDFVILTRRKDRAREALDHAAELLARHGLKLNREKTRVTDFSRGFKFLGHMFVRSLAMKLTPEEADTLNTESALRQLARDDAVCKEAKRTEEADLAAKEARGYSPGLRNLYIMQRGRRLAIRNQAFAVEEMTADTDPLTGTPAQWRELIAVPHQVIDRIDLGPDIEATPAALDHGLSTGTPICFVDGRGRTQGILAPTLSTRAGRHIAQAAVKLDEEKRLALARILVMGRLRNERALLRKLTRERNTVPTPVTRAIATLTKLIGRGETSRIVHAPSVASVMGYEGEGTAAYWPAVSALAHEDFRFSKRKRKEVPGPANIALNFLAWMLHRDVSVAVLSAGLHPGFGTLHAISDNRDACVYDLMEEFRSHLIEGLFVYVTNRRILRFDMFEKRSDGGWRMHRRGSRALIRAYETRAATPIAWPEKTRRASFRRLITEQAYRLARHFEKEETYQPFELDY